MSYKQNFNFDRFGNMYRKAASNPTTGQETPLPYTPIEDSNISKATNRFASDTTYDDAGNVIVDDKFRAMSFSYDANGRMVKATRDQVPDALSVYDASGLRVAEYVNDVWRFMIYDIGGKLVAEYGGLQSTDEGGVKYVLQDWQGSTRAIVGNTGNVQSRSDYTAFGERIGSGTGLRTGLQGFGKGGSLRQGYALTEKDDATGLDHTWFRKNENQAGRWTSPDPYNGSMSLGDPQSFNRYSYVSNQPTNYVDPTGLQEDQWVCELWTTFRDPDGPDGPIAPYEIGPRFWQCYLVPGGGGPNATVDVPIDFGDGGSGGSDQSAQNNPCNTTPNPFGIRNDALGGAGTGMQGQPGTFRLNNNNAGWSPKHYLPTTRNPTGYQGGFGIRTYSMTGVGRNVARGATGVSIVIGAVDVGSSAIQEGGFGQNTQVATGRTVGGLGGAWAGAKLGAGTGALLGSFVPIVGTAGGAIVGGLIGAGLGGYLGSKAGENVVCAAQGRN